MCKIAMMSGIKPTKIKQAWELAKALAPYMSKNDDDGFGYAAITKKGDVFVERWLDNDQAFRFKANNKADKELKHSIGKALETYEHGYSSEGSVNRSEATAIILHSRMATCTKGLKNVHPFVVNDQALIHNGVISNHEQVLKTYDTNNTRLSTCDSEAIAFTYAANDVLNNPSAIRQVGEDLRGYYACAVLGKDAKGIPYMDVFKSTSASLYAAHVPQIGGIVYCTSIDILKAAVKDCGFIYYQPYKIKSELLIRHNAVTGVGNVLAEFKEQGYGGYSYYGDDAAWEGYGSYGHGYSRGRYVGGSASTTTSSTTINAQAHTVVREEKSSTITWEEYQDKRGEASRSNEESVGEIIDASSSKVVALPSNPNNKYNSSLYNIPKQLLAIEDIKKRKQAIQDFETIRELFYDFRSDLTAKRVAQRS